MSTWVPYSWYVSAPISAKMVWDEKIRSPHPCVTYTWQVIYSLNIIKHTSRITSPQQGTVTACNVSSPQHTQPLRAQLTAVG